MLMSSFGMVESLRCGEDDRGLVTFYLTILGVDVAIDYTFLLRALPSIYIMLLPCTSDFSLFVSLRVSAIFNFYLFKLLAY